MGTGAIVDEVVRRALLGVAEPLSALACAYHRATLEGVENIPEGGALLVGNHGLFGYETPVFFLLLLRGTKRYPVGLADLGFFKIPLVRSVLPRLGGLPGTRSEARAALSRGELVVCYPGGAEEVFKESHRRYRLRWERRLGFARVASETGAPVVPFAGVGVDDTFFTTGRQLTERLLRAGRYAPPLGFGLGPLPLPASMCFRMGAPLWPPPPAAGEGALLAFRDQVAARVHRLLLRPSA